MAWAVLSLLNRQWDLHHEQEEPSSQRLRFWTISTWGSSGPGWCFGSISYDWKFAGLQIWQYLLRLCPTFPCRAFLLRADGGVYAPCSLLLQLAVRNWSSQLDTLNLKSVRLCKAPESFGKESISEPPTSSLPSSHLLKKKATVFKIWYFLWIFLAGDLPWGAQISSLHRH